MATAAPPLPVGHNQRRRRRDRQPSTVTAVIAPVSTTSSTATDQLLGTITTTTPNPTTTTAPNPTTTTAPNPPPTSSAANRPRRSQRNQPAHRQSQSATAIHSTNSSNPRPTTTTTNTTSFNAVPPPSSYFSPSRPSRHRQVVNAETLVGSLASMSIGGPLLPQPSADVYLNGNGSKRSTASSSVQHNGSDQNGSTTSVVNNDNRSDGTIGDTRNNSDRSSRNTNNRSSVNKIDGSNWRKGSKSDGPGKNSNSSNWRNKGDGSTSELNKNEGKEPELDQQERPNAPKKKKKKQKNRQQDLNAVHKSPLAGDDVSKKGKEPETLPDEDAGTDTLKSTVTDKQLPLDPKEASSSKPSKKKKKPRKPKPSPSMVEKSFSASPSQENIATSSTAPLPPSQANTTPNALSQRQILAKLRPPLRHKGKRHDASQTSIGSSDRMDQQNDKCSNGDLQRRPQSPNNKFSSPQNGAARQTSRQRRGPREFFDVYYPDSDIKLLQTFIGSSDRIDQRKERQNGAARQTPRQRRGPREFFDVYWPDSEIKLGLEKRILFEGLLRMSKKQRRVAYVTVDGQDDIVIVGNRDRNRALNGDSVVVEILGELPRNVFRDSSCGSALLKERGLWKPSELDEKVQEKTSQQDTIIESEEKVVVPESEDVLLNHVPVMEAVATEMEVDDEEDDENLPHKIGRIVSIIERRPGQIYSGLLMPSTWRPGMRTKEIDAAPNEGNPSDNNGNSSTALDSKEKNNDRKKQPANVYFRPFDNRAPLLLVPRSEVPEDLDTNYDRYENKIFIVAIRRWPITTMYPFGHLKRSVGNTGEIQAETEAILAANCIRTQPFNRAVENCLPKLPFTIPESEIARRKDLRKQCIFTIDPETAKDLDDAVSCVPLPDGNFRIGVHIADVSYFVKPKTSLDTEASLRATTTYLVQKAVPMLPSILCEDLCSLNPGVDRLAFSVEWTMTPDAEVMETWFGRTVIQSCIKMSYGNAQDLIDGKSWQEAVGQPLSGNQSEEDVIANVKTFRRLSQIMRRRRFSTGALTINQPKLAFRLGPDSEPADCFVYEIKDSNRLIEEFMLLANMSVAKKISDTFSGDALLRSHTPPSPKPLKEFLEYTTQMGFQLDATSAGALQASIERIEDAETKQILQLLAIKPMQRARYFCTGEFENDESRWSHYALNVPRYTHFTSPIRRYADVLVHRMLQAALDGTTPISPREQIIKFARVCNIKKEDARASQDASSRLFLCLYLLHLEKLLNEPIIEEAIVMDCGEKSFDVYLPRYAIDRRIYLDDCGAARVKVIKKGCELEVDWPKTYTELPPYPVENRPQTVETVEETCKVLTFMPTYELAQRQRIKMMTKVFVRLAVYQRAPMDVKVYVIHPDHIPAVTTKVPHVEGSTSSMLEQFNEVE